jgi:hypothetical protein
MTKYDLINKRTKIKVLENADIEYCLAYITHNEYVSITGVAPCEKKK